MPLSALTGTKLRDRRLAAGLRQADVALRAGISASYLNLIEHNRRKVTPEVMERLAEALGIDRAALADRKEAALVDGLRPRAARRPRSRLTASRTSWTAFRAGPVFLWRLRRGPWRLNARSRR
jgi:transcriptional regulator with XRE-family HTH domain